MKKTQWIYYIIVAVLLGLYTWVQMNETAAKEEEKESFAHDRSIAYGSQVLYERLNDYFPDAEVEVWDYSPYDYLPDAYSGNSGYIFINDNIITDEYNVRELLHYVEMGNHVLLVSRRMPFFLTDTFGISINYGFAEDVDSTALNFLHPAYKNGAKLNIPRDFVYAYMKFEENDSLQRSALAQNFKQEINMVKINYGEGTLILSTLPKLFTNYHLLYEDNYRYANYAFSFLPKDLETIYWDNYFKIEQEEARERDRDPLRYVLSQEALKWALRIAIALGFLFVLFQSKRKQRIIPLVKPLPNASLDFIDTIGRLYYQQGEHGKLANKLIKLWKDHIWHQYRLRADLFTDDFMWQLSGKSGVPKEQIKNLCHEIDKIQRQQVLNANELINFHTELASFYKQSKQES